MSPGDLDALLAESGVQQPPVSPEVYCRLEQFLELRSRWLQIHNVAGPKARRTPWVVDVIDAFALNQLMDDHQALVDVGTGSGTPGLLIGCISPNTPLVLVEPIAKRTAFLRDSIARLGLARVRIQRDRWPCDVSHETYQIVSRAVVPPQAWPKLAIAGSTKPTTVYRMLASQRPDWNTGNYSCTSLIDYQLPTTEERRIERWDAINPLT